MPDFALVIFNSRILKTISYIMINAVKTAKSRQAGLLFEIWDLVLNTLGL